MIDIEGLKDSISCRQFLEAVGIKINRSGFAVCPFHADNDASLKLYGEKSWYCFGCRKGGDVISLASLFYGLDFRQTISKLNADFHLNFEDGDYSASNALLARLKSGMIKSSREREERLRNASESRYWLCYEHWRDADWKVRELEPQRDAQEWPDEFVEALKERENLLPDLAYADDERRSYYGRCSDPARSDNAV